MSGVMTSVDILPDVWCYDFSGYPARCLLLCEEESSQMSGVVSVTSLPDVCCYVSSYSARCLVLCQWLSCQMNGVMSVAIPPDV